MRIGEIAGRAGVPAKTIRFWEDQGLLPPPGRTPAGYRDYDPAVLDRLAFIRHAQAALLATLVRSHSQLAVLTSIGAILLSTLGGALLPLSMMPSIAQHVAPASPGYWAISMLKSAVRGDTAGTLGPAALLGAIAVAAGNTACLRLRRGPAQLRS